MVLLNASSRSRNVGRLIVQNQGGGDKKAGFPHQIGRESWSSIFLNSVDTSGQGRCCTLAETQRTLVFTKNIGRPSWVRPGAAYGFPSFP